MSGIGFWELVVLFVIGLMILGPERLPRVASQVGRWIGKARRTANQLRYQLEREVALADIEETRKHRKHEADRSTATRPSGHSSGPRPDAPAPGSDAAAAPGDPAASGSDVKADSSDADSSATGDDDPKP